MPRHKERKMNDWIDEMRNQSEYFAGLGPTNRPNYIHQDPEIDVVKKSHKKEKRLDKQLHLAENKKAEITRKNFENFCDSQYLFYISKLQDCKGKEWYAESFNHSHISKNPNVHTDLAYCYDRGLYFVENENDDTSIFAILPVFSDKNYHFTFCGATRTLLSSDNGDCHYAYIGFVRNGCKSHVFHEFFPEDSIVSSLPEKCPITGVKASHLFTVLSDRYSDCKDAISLMSKNDESHVAPARTVNCHEDAPTR